VVLGGYGGAIRDGVLRGKRPAGHELLGALAGLLHRRHVSILRDWASDVVVPVPLHWWRRTIRGADAAAEIARQLGRLTSTPMHASLRRRQATVMQNRLPPEARRANVRDAFKPSGRAVAGRRVLLVDDVVTTGGTLSACVRVLREAGATAVHVAVIARADQPSDDGAVDR
jgi:ComF family protein